MKQLPSAMMTRHWPWVGTLTLSKSLILIIWIVHPERSLLKKKKQLAELNKKKAMDAEKVGNYRIALNRYEYLLNLYLELDYDPIQREHIKQKIDEMKEKTRYKAI